MKEVEDVSRVQRVPWSALQGELVRFTEGRTDIIFNIPGSKQGTPDSVPLLYKTFRGAVLASFTRTHQQHPEDGEMICYETGWIEKGELLDAEREDALMQLSAAAAAILGCYWVWCSSRAGAGTGTGAATAWKKDGQFHWYAFHWTPGFYRNLHLWLSL
jgi:hypothetical protein